MAKNDETLEEMGTDLEAAKSRISALETEVEEVKTALAQTQQDLKLVEDKATEATGRTRPAWVNGLDELDEGLRNLGGISLAQSLALAVKAVTGHDIKVEQTSNAPQG